MEDRILTPDEWAKAYNSISVPELPYEGIPVRDLETLKQQDAKTAHQVAEEIFEELDHWHYNSDTEEDPDGTVVRCYYYAIPEDVIETLKARWLK